MLGSGGPLIQPGQGSVKSQEKRRKHWEPRWEKKLHSALFLRHKYVNPGLVVAQSKEGRVERERLSEGGREMEGNSSGVPREWLSA